jgi:hypothetical protein
MIAGEKITKTRQQERQKKIEQQMLQKKERKLDGPSYER